ncbi:activated RNA polymerase II transcriptional coactivator p15 [Trichogramma pretiosum]|uniref:activated RNA polymerase II transcriptional coactivator p15 n=1 Tax=Trichogramma pretiosum TaxID=7493 RepID=UPI0006C95050|nr:activated RNA polymerase II transcriptional coactivator p15 [Trichogramma pretiosum]
MPKSKETISTSESGSESEEEVKQKSMPASKKRQLQEKEKEKKKKKPKSESESEASEASEASDSEEEAKSKKRPKKTNNKAPAKKAKTNDDGETSWELGNMKFVTIRTFKGKLLVDIREKYMDKNSGDLKPGKKGISLNVENWKQFYDIVEEVNEAVKSQ